VLAHIDELALLVTMEQGKPLANARSGIGASLRQVEFFGAITLDPEVIRDDGTGRVEVRRAPIGVVGAITVWNHPMLTAMFEIVPALVAGSVVIAKSWPYTPVATLRLGELLQEILPPGVVQVVAGTDELGPALTHHPGIHKISFTGSVETGEHVMAAAAGTLKRVTPELGGNDAGIVLDDADPAAVGADLFWAGFSNSGQVCAALKRLYVPAATFDAICEAVAAEAATVVVGPGLQEGVTAGHLHRPRRGGGQDQRHHLRPRRVRVVPGSRPRRGGSRPPRRGSVWVNRHPVVTASVPFGGAKQSGIGVEGSLHGLHAYPDTTVLSTKR
jgi:acyl-CoA reductase-like NAD-dependent aldehyde dehydrogenase